jgi:hypothetical protein
LSGGIPIEIIAVGNQWVCYSITFYQLCEYRVMNLLLFGKVEAGADRAQHPPAPSDITPVTGKWRIETVEINGPVQIGEVRVAAGDLVVADDTGVCFIPRDVVLEVLDAAEQKAKAEAVRCKAIDDGVPVPTASKLRIFGFEPSKQALIARAPAIKLRCFRIPHLLRSTLTCKLQAQHIAHGTTPYVPPSPNYRSNGTVARGKEKSHTCRPLKRLSILASFCQNRHDNLSLYNSTITTNALLRNHALEAMCCHRAPLFAPRGGAPSCRIESPDRKLAPRQRTSFVAIHDRKPLSHVGKDGCEFLRPLWPRPCVVQDAGRKRLQ